MNRMRNLFYSVGQNCQGPGFKILGKHALGRGVPTQPVSAKDSDENDERKPQQSEELKRP